MSGIVNATVVLNGLTLGIGTQFQIDEDGIQGLGVPQTKTADSSFDGQDGASAAPDFLDVRVITIPLVVLGANLEDATGLLDELNAAWVPAEDGVDVELAISIGTDWSRVFTGRARGVETDLALIGDGMLLALCRFDAMNPVGAEAGS